MAGMLFEDGRKLASFEKFSECWMHETWASIQNGRSEQVLFGNLDRNRHFHRPPDALDGGHLGGLASAGPEKCRSDGIADASALTEVLGLAASLSQFLQGNPLSGSSEAISTVGLVSVALWPPAPMPFRGGQVLYWFFHSALWVTE